MTHSDALGGSPLILIFTFLIALFFLERLFPLRTQTRPLAPRLAVNGILSIFTFVFASWLVRPVSLATLQWSSERSFGLLHWVSPSPWFQGIAGFLLLDLSFYYWHRLNHEVQFFWRFHNVHHLDPDLDVTSGFRFHFGEVSLSVFFRLIQILLIGPQIQVFLIYEIVFQMETYFHHSNIRLPVFLERLLDTFLVTPRMHGVHHSQKKEETNSNYSVILNVWDKIHATFRKQTAETSLEIGVPGYSDEKSNQLMNVLLIPFQKQRDYWSRRL